MQGTFRVSEESVTTRIMNASRSAWLEAVEEEGLGAHPPSGNVGRGSCVWPSADGAPGPQEWSIC
jgi:hypothetical protein